MGVSAIFRTHGIPYAFWGRLLCAALCSVFLGITAAHGAEIRAPWFFPRVAAVHGAEIRVPWFFPRVAAAHGAEIREPSLLGAAAAHGAEIRAPQVAVLVSRDIRPYLEAVEGMSVVLGESANARVQVFSLEKFTGKSRDVLIQNISGEKFDLLIAVGPEAVRFAADEALAEKAPSPWLYSMVLNPPKVSGRAETACGIPLDIPARRQLEMVSQGLPAVRRLGLLYDPRYNSEFFQKAAAEAPALGVKVVPLKVSAKKDIPAVLKQNWENIDALWLVPDQTVISESIVQYIIKEALFKKIPVVGYNRFFYESGAALAFVFDYEELGRQTGRLAADMLRGKACEKASPVFLVWLNLRVIDKLGMSVPEKTSPPLEVGP